MTPSLTWMSVVLQLIAVCSGCTEPVPHHVTQIDERDGPGTVILTMPGPSTSTSSSSPSWSFSISNPSSHSAFLREFFNVTQNTNGWQLVLSQALDIEAIKTSNNFILSDITLNLQCTETNSQSQLSYHRTVLIGSVSEFRPVIAQPLPRFNVSEDAKLGTVVVSLRDYVTDEDVVSNGQLTDIKRFSKIPYMGQHDGVSDGDEMFGVTRAGDVILLKEVDYESGERMFGINFTVQDMADLSSWSVVKIEVVNANDNPPSFVFTSNRGKLQQVAEYRCYVEASFTGPITSLEPGPIAAVDPDDDVINYHIATGYPNDYNTYIRLDSSLGTVSILQPALASNITHFTLVIEARDGFPSQQKGAPNQVHKATASLLIFVSGRSMNFSATPEPESSSNLANVNTDALFICVIILSTLFVILVIAVVVMACKIRRDKRRKAFLQNVDRCNTMKERKPSDWSIQMRPVERGSEKEFMRSLSRGTPYTNEGFTNNEMNDEVFVTGVAPYIDLRSGSQTDIYDHDTISRGIVPYTAQQVIRTPAPTRSSASTLPRRSASNNVPGQSLTSPSSFQTPANVTETLNSLDLLTSVKPITEDNRQPMVPSYVDRSGTLRKMKGSSDVLTELEQIVLSENKYNDDRDNEKVTRFAKDNTINSFDSSHDPRTTDDGVTVFGKDDIDFSVTPFDHNSNVDNKSFHFTGDLNPNGSSPGNPFRGEHVFNSADVYYRQNSDSQNTNHNNSSSNIEL